MDLSGVLIGIIAAAVVILLALVHIYNRVVMLHNKVRDAWSDIDVQLGFRHNLVPNLVESVKGYATHERETLHAVTQARSAAMRAGADPTARAFAEGALSSAIGSLVAVAERYPELKASQNFLLLQEQLTTTENRIAFARQHYNECVRQFNTVIAEFPWSLVAGLLGYVSQPMFTADAADRASVRMTA